MKFFKITITLIILLILPFQLAAQEDDNEPEDKRHPLLQEKFFAQVGVFVPQKDIQFGASGDVEDGDIDFGKTFDFNDNEVTFFFSAEWRWNEKWRVNGEYFGVNNAARATLPNDITIGDITFEKGTYVRGGVEFSLFRVFVGRTISSGPKHSLGAGLGVHAMNIGAFIEGEVLTNIGDKEFRAPRVSVLVPLPNIGGWYQVAPNEKWAFVARLDWFGISIDQYSGGLWNVAPGVKYQIIKNLGLGLDYRFLFLNAKVDDDNWSGKFDMNFSGPLFTIHGNF